MNAVEMMEVLKNEYGITSYEEFEKRASETVLDISIFTRRIENNGREENCARS